MKNGPAWLVVFVFICTLITLLAQPRAAQRVPFVLSECERQHLQMYLSNCKFH